MTRNNLLGVLSALAVAFAAIASNPAVFVAEPTTWPLCGAFSLFSKDECAAIKYCVNTDDPACQQAGTQPSTVPTQRRPTQ